MLIDSVAIVRLLSAFFLIFLYSPIFLFVLPRSFYVEIHKNTNDILFCKSFLLTTDKKIKIRQVKSIKISNEICDDFIIFNTAESAFKICFGISLFENQLVAFRISEFLGIEIFNNNTPPIRSPQQNASLCNGKYRRHADKSDDQHRDIKMGI